MVQRSGDDRTATRHRQTAKRKADGSDASRRQELNRASSPPLARQQEDVAPEVLKVVLTPMTDEEYAAWSAASILAFAADKIRSGNWAEIGAIERAHREHRELLPHRQTSEGHALFTARDTRGEAVGHVWLYFGQGPHGFEAYIYDIGIVPEKRGRGFGRASLLAAESEARRCGARRLALHVFGFNLPARQLYHDLGFVETNVNMSKALS